MCHYKAFKMNKLLIIPGNSAIRYNPSDPSGFPSLTEQALVPGAAMALEFYKSEDFKIVVCENAGGIERGINTLQQKLSEFIILMTRITPLIDQLIFCPDFKGAFAYVLTKETPNSFPVLRRLRCVRVLGYNALKAPGDDSGLWEDVDVQPFRKSDAGMLQWAIASHTPQQTVVVWERTEDKDAAEAIAQQGVCIQSAMTWRKLDPTVNECAAVPLQPTTPTMPPPATGRQKLRRFELIDPIRNFRRFWTIRMTADELSFDINFGRIGTNGRTTPIRKTFTSASAAKRDYQNRIEDQLKQGYVEV
jgi:predicted DNA-binding WGR domain protein/histidinol phosphatase-like enzyme